MDAQKISYFNATERRALAIAGFATTFEEGQHDPSAQVALAMAGCVVAAIGIRCTVTDKMITNGVIGRLLLKIGNLIDEEIAQDSQRN